MKVLKLFGILINQKHQPYQLVREQWNPAFTLEKVLQSIRNQVQMSAIAAGQKTWSSLLEILASKNHRILCFVLPIF